MAKVKIAQSPDAPVEKEVLAEAIVSISSSMSKLLASGMNRRAVVTLIAYDTGVSRTHIDAVLNSLESLKHNYCR